MIHLLQQLEIKVKGSLRQGTIPTKPRFRSVPDVAVLSAQPEWAVC